MSSEGIWGIIFMFLKKDTQKKYFLFYYLNIDAMGGDEALSCYSHLVTMKGTDTRAKASVLRMVNHGGALPLNSLPRSNFLIG